MPKRRVELLLTLAMEAPAAGRGQQGLDAEEGALEDNVAELVDDVPIVSEDAAGQDKSVSCGSGLTVGYQRACRGRTAHRIEILSFPSFG